MRVEKKKSFIGALMSNKLFSITLITMSVIGTLALSFYIHFGPIITNYDSEISTLEYQLTEQGIMELRSNITNLIEIQIEYESTVEELNVKIEQLNKQIENKNVIIERLENHLAESELEFVTLSGSVTVKKLGFSIFTRKISGRKVKFTSLLDGRIFIVNVNEDHYFIDIKNNMSYKVEVEYPRLLFGPTWDTIYEDKNIVSSSPSISLHL